MPRGKYVNHKGRGRSFTSAEELERERREMAANKLRRKEEEDESEEESDQEGGSSEAKTKGKKDPMQQPPRDMPPSESSEDEDTDSEEDGDRKAKGVEHLLAGEIQNPNRVVHKPKKLKNLDGPSPTPNNAPSASASASQPELSRREREAIEKQRAKERYQKLHAEGKTEEARKDLARLAIIRKQREEAAAKRAEELAGKDAVKQQKQTDVAKALGKK